MKANPKQTPPWVRWTYLALAAFQLLMIWADVREYQQYRFYVESGIFSPAGLQDAFSGHAYRWVMSGFLCIVFLFAFAAMIADSLRRFSRSAPVKPEVDNAILWRSTSSDSGFFAA